MIHPYTYMGLNPKIEEMLNKRTLANKIIKEVAEIAGINPKELMSKRRFRNYVQARQIICWMLKKTYDINLVQIGNLISKDHTTIIHLLKNHENDYAQNVLYKAMSDKIKRKHP